MPSQYTIERFRPSESDIHFADGTEAAWSFDEGAWTRWIADAYRFLAAPTLPQRFPMAPGSADDVFAAAAYWDPLVHLLLYRLGWARPDLGMEWWHRAGKPTDDPTLALVAAIWDADGYLDWFVAWVASLDNDAFPLNTHRSSKPETTVATFDRAWIAEQLEAAEASGIHNPLSGGSDALHLRDHCRAPLRAAAPRAELLRTSRSSRRAVLTLDAAHGWYRTLMELGGQLPDIDPRSWRVDVYVRSVGWLGTYRRSRKTGLWFSGRHRTHMAGNA